MDCIDKIDLTYILNNISDILNENFKKRSKILLTGATGFFGKWLLESFLHLNEELGLDTRIIALSRNPILFLEQYPHFKKEKKINWIRGDITNFEFPEGKFDYIIHAATDADSKINIDNPLLMLDTITLGTKRVLEFARIHPEIKSMLLTSSGAIYGNQPENVTHIRESDSFYLDINDPGSSYAEGKRLAELYCAIYARKFNLPIRIVRCFTFVGPYLPIDRHYAVGNFIQDGIKRQNITIHGDGAPLRTYMYGADLVIWILTILLKGNIGEAYNVGSDIPISIKKLALKIADFFPAISVNILNQIHPTDRNFNYVPDISKAKEQFHFGDGITFDEAIYRTIKYHRQND
jgi:dTDP-glucose 4,6-dehydratase